jgi:hypothetical protein
MGFLTVLFLIFLTLKLTAFIDWSWWMVCAPLYPAVAVWTGLIAVFIWASITTELSIRRRATKRRAG